MSTKYCWLHYEKSVLVSTVWGCNNIFNSTTKKVQNAKYHAKKMLYCTKKKPYDARGVHLFRKVMERKSQTNEKFICIFIGYTIFVSENWGRIKMFSIWPLKWVFVLLLLCLTAWVWGIEKYFSFVLIVDRVTNHFRDQ